jgi:cytochrome b561
MTVKRYHPALVAIHWLSAALLLFALAMGSQILSAMPNSSPDKLGALQGHMIGGGLVLLLTLIRLVIRVKTSHPPAATTGMAWADRIAPLVHWALYALVLMMAGTGVAMSVAFDLPTIVFGGQGSLPPDFHTVVARSVHGLVSKLLFLLILAHVGAALFHRFVKKDGLLSRMAFGSRDGS